MHRQPAEAAVENADHPKSLSITGPCDAILTLTPASMPRAPFRQRPPTAGSGRPLPIAAAARSFYNKPTAGARRSPSRTAYVLELRLWIDSKPEVPDDDWYKDFGSFKICGKGALPKTFLLRGQGQGRLTESRQADSDTNI